jgi:diadenosine tetraphosphate (Ap4A) HIT family hydrolase
MKYLDLLRSKRPCPFDNPNGSDIVLQNETAYLTYSIAGYHPDQLLVIPKRHITHIDEMTDQEFKDCETLQKQGWELLRALGHGGVSFLLREGASTGKSVSHLHYNLFPDTRLGDMSAHGEERREVMTEVEIQETLTRLREAQAKVAPH